MMKVHLGRVLSGVAAGLTVVVGLLWLAGFDPGMNANASSEEPLNDGTAQWTLSSAQTPVSLPAGATCATRKITGPRPCTLTLVFFSEPACKVQIASQGSLKNALRISQWAPQTSAVACCNGGYFQPQTMLPGSLEIASGVRTGTFGSSGASGGAFGLRKGRLFLENERQFKVTDDITEFIQCGPLLVEDGKPLVMASERTRNRRTFVMTDRKGHWAIGAAETASYSGLAAMLVNPRIIPEFKVSMALNLDGGPSTGLWWRDAAGRTDQIKEGWPVRNVLLVIPQ